MTRISRYRLLAVLLAAGLVVTGAWLVGRESTADATQTAAGGVVPMASPLATVSDATGTPAASVADVDANPPAPAASTSVAAAAAPEPLPPPDTAVAGIFDDLLARARRGDARAACRLASELQRCRRQPPNGRQAAHMELAASAEANTQRRERMIESIAWIEEEQQRNARLCEALEPAQLQLAFPLQLQAAQARPELRLWVALNPALDSHFFVNDLDQWQQYHQLALPWLEAAAAEGDLSAVIALARVHGDQRGYGPRTPPFRQLDDARFLTYATLLERYGARIPPVQREAEEARARLSPSALAEVDRRAGELFNPQAAADLSTEAHGIAMGRSFAPMPKASDCE